MLFLFRQNIQYTTKRFRICFTEICFHNIQYCGKLFLSNSKMQANRSMTSEHWLYASNSGKNRYCSEFAFFVGQQITFKNVCKEMFFQKMLYGRSKFRVASFWSICQYSGKFSKYVAPTFVTTSFIIDRRCFATHRIVYALGFPLLNNLHECLNSPQTAWESSVCISMNQNLFYFIDCHARFQGLYECLLQMFQITFACV